MQRPREQLLAGAALPFEQHGGVGRRRALQRGEHLAQRRIFADELRRAAADRQLLLHQQVLGHEAALLERAADEQQQVIRIDRLGEEVERPFLHRRHGVLDAAVRRHDDDRHVGVDFLRGAQHAEPVPFGQAEIGEDQRGLRLLQEPHRLGLIARLDDGMPLPLERMPQHRSQRVFVFDEENLGRSGHARARGTSADPAGRNAGLARLLFDVDDRLFAALDLGLDAIELGERLLAILADLGALARIVAVDEVGGRAR